MKKINNHRALIHFDQIFPRLLSIKVVISIPLQNKTLSDFVNPNIFLIHPTKVGVSGAGLGIKDCFRIGKSAIIVHLELKKYLKI